MQKRKGLPHKFHYISATIERLPQDRWSQKHCWSVQNPSMRLFPNLKAWHLSGNLRVASHISTHKNNRQKSRIEMGHRYQSELRIRVRRYLRPRSLIYHTCLIVALKERSKVRQTHSDRRTTLSTSTWRPLELKLSRYRRHSLGNSLWCPESGKLTRHRRIRDPSLKSREEYSKRQEPEWSTWWTQE